MQGALLGPKVIPRATETTRAVAMEGPLVPCYAVMKRMGGLGGSRPSHLPSWEWKPGRHGAQRPCPGSCLGSQASSALGARRWFCSACESERNHCL